MREGPSQTASWVAMARWAGRLLPKSMELVADPYGERFGNPVLRRALAFFEQHPSVTAFALPRASLASDLIYWMQLRTRAIDDVLRRFYERGGRQVVLLGAGYDARALRLQTELSDAVFFEVDHPSTQAVKRARMPPDYPARFLSWDFETCEVRGLVGRLVSHGLDRSRAVLTIWEGVTMYLSPEAIDQTLSVVHSLGPTDSVLVFNYVDAEALTKPKRSLRAVMHIVGRAGEPYRFGLLPNELSSFLSARGFALETNVSEATLARLLMPTSAHRVRGDKGRYVCVARTR